MKKMRREARCTSTKGKESRTEIREPFGSGMDKKREAEAIRQNLRVPRETLMSS
jgi:hypothetical protein